MKNLAEKYHAGQTRQGEGYIPYIVHPRDVVETLISWGEKEDSPLIEMAWGHDLLEDTAVTEQEILAVSSERVLNGIKMLTHAGNVDKAAYLQSVADSGNRDVLLVKISDRICNTNDFVILKGNLYAYNYMHKADCLIPALEKISDDPVVQNALKTWKDLNYTLREKALHDAIRGCLLGGAVGDALGAPIEFLPLRSIKKLYGTVDDYVEYTDGTGRITDDTQMTLFTAEGILRAHVRGKERGICSPESIVKFAYLRWLETQRITPDAPEDFINSGWLIKEKDLFVSRAPGSTCISALIRGKQRAENNSKGCGTVMRMAPVGLFFDPVAAYEYGCKFSAITHGHPTGITAGGAFAMLISYLRKGTPLKRSLELVQAHLRKYPEAAETLAALEHAETAENISELGEGWVAEEALAIAVFCVLRHQWDFKAGIIEAINITGDSDSTGSIAGNILGLLNGEKAIPEKWLSNLREHRIVSQVSDDLFRRFESNSEGHVSEDWWNKYPGF